MIQKCFVDINVWCTQQTEAQYDLLLECQWEWNILSTHETAGTAKVSFTLYPRV